MIKQFIIPYSSDSSWTGGGVNINENHLEEMDKALNKYCDENKVNPINVYNSYVNRNSQIGTNEANTQRNIYLITTLIF